MSSSSSDGEVFLFFDGDSWIGVEGVPLLRFLFKLVELQDAFDTIPPVLKGFVRRLSRFVRRVTSVPDQDEIGTSIFVKLLRVIL